MIRGSTRITTKYWTVFAVTKGNNFQLLIFVTNSSTQNSVVVLVTPSTLYRKTRQNSRSYHILKFNSLIEVNHYADFFSHRGQNQNQGRFLIKWFLLNRTIIFWRIFNFTSAMTCFNVTIWDADLNLTKNLYYFFF